MHHAIPITLVVFNDNAFGNVRRFQIENYNNRPIASNLTSPDFVALAESFGGPGCSGPDAGRGWKRAFAS